MFIGRTDAEAEAPVLWPRDAKSQLFGKDTDAGQDWGQEDKGAIDEMAEWITDAMDMSLQKLREIVKDREAWHAAVHGLQRVGQDLVTGLQQEQLVIAFFHMPVDIFSPQHTWLFSGWQFWLSSILLSSLLRETCFYFSEVILMLISATGIFWLAAWNISLLSFTAQPSVASWEKPSLTSRLGQLSVVSRKHLGFFLLGFCHRCRFTLIFMLLWFICLSLLYTLWGKESC